MRKSRGFAVIMAGVIILFYVFKRPLSYAKSAGAELRYNKSISQADRKSALVFYVNTQPHYSNKAKVDSLQHSYGFAEAYRGDVSQESLDIYNRQIEKELIRRIGFSRWNEYLQKASRLGEGEVNLFLSHRAQ